MKYVFPILSVALATSLGFSTSDARADRAADDAAWRLKKSKEYCTFAGEISNVCVELRQKIDANRFKDDVKYTADYPAHSNFVANCFDEALRASEKIQDITSTAGDLLRSDLKEDRFIAECYRVTDKVHGGPAWRKPYELMKARTVFVQSVRTKVESDFKKACGVFAHVEGAGGIKIILEKSNPKNGKVFFQGKNPDGDTVTVKCTGKVVSVSPSGSSMETEPQTEADSNRDTEEWACVQRCAKTHIACASSRNPTESVCGNACRKECSR